MTKINFWRGLLITLIISTITIPTMLGNWIFEYYGISIKYLNHYSVLLMIWCVFVFMLIIKYLSKQIGIKLRDKIYYKNITLKLLISVVLISFIFHFISIPFGLAHKYFELFNSGNIILFPIPLPSSVYNTFIWWLYLFSSIIIYPVFEEIVFRKFILNQFICQYSVPLSIILSALLFSIYHIEPSKLIFTFVLGLLIGIVYYKTGYLLLVIILHSLINLWATLSGHYVFYLQNFFFSVWYIPVIIVGIVIIYLCLKYLDKLNGNKKHDVIKNNFVIKDRSN